MPLDHICRECKKRPATITVSTPAGDALHFCSNCFSVASRRMKAAARRRRRNGSPPQPQVNPNRVLPL